jgi:hypothetical protein
MVKGAHFLQKNSTQLIKNLGQAGVTTHQQNCKK